MYTMFRCELNEKELEHVIMLHSHTPDSVKKQVREDIGNPNGKIRILTATTAAGMGVNYKAVNNMVNYGPQNNMDTFMQQLGRAGRDGTHSKSLLLFHGRQCKKLDTVMKDFINNSDECTP